MSSTSQSGVPEAIGTEERTKSRTDKTSRTQTRRQKENYLDIETDYKGLVEYDGSIPLSLPDFKNILYPLANEVYCGYRPTALEIQSLGHLVSATDIGPVVDLIDPVAAYPVFVPPSPSPDDAILLVGLIPGVEKFLTGSKKWESSVVPEQHLSQTDSSHVPIQPNPNVSPQGVMNAIVEQFNLTTFTHPLKPNLKPIKILELLPSPNYWCHKFVHSSLQHVDRVTYDRPLILKSLENVSQRLRNFALYEKMETRTGEQKSSSASGELKSSFASGDYLFVRDFIARMPEDHHHGTHLIIEMPNNETSSVQPAYFFQLRGPKLMFTRTTEIKKARPPLRLISRPPTEEELLEEKTKLNLLRNIEIPTPTPPSSNKPSIRRSFSTSSSDADGAAESRHKKQQQETEQQNTETERRQQNTERRKQNTEGSKQSRQSSTRRRRLRKKSTTSESSVSSSSSSNSSGSSSSESDSSS